MARFNVENFMPLTEDGRSFDIFSSPLRHIQAVTTESIVVVTAGLAHNLPTLAHRYLGDTGLWWALLMYNQLTDPIADVTPGLQLKIPRKSELVQLLEVLSAKAQLPSTRL